MSESRQIGIQRRRGCGAVTGFIGGVFGGIRDRHGATIPDPFRMVPHTPALLRHFPAAFAFSVFTTCSIAMFTLTAPRSSAAVYLG